MNITTAVNKLLSYFNKEYNFPMLHLDNIVHVKTLFNTFSFFKEILDEGKEYENFAKSIEK